MRTTSSDGAQEAEKDRRLVLGTGWMPRQFISVAAKAETKPSVAPSIPDPQAAIPRAPLRPVTPDAGEQEAALRGHSLFLVASLGFLSKASLPVGGEVSALQPNAAWAVLLGAGLWYLCLDWKVGLGTCTAFLAGYVVGSRQPVDLLGALFGAGVVAHTVGHYGFEGKPPTLFSKPVSVLEAPAWLLATWAGLYRERP